MQLIDLSHTIRPEMPRFRGMPEPEIHAWRSHAETAASGVYEGCSCEISQINFVTSLGTYMDSPYHFDPDGAAIEQLTLEQLVLPGLVVDCSHIGTRRPIGPELLDGLEIAGKALLFHTGWDRYWGQDRYFDHPYLTRATAETLRDRGAKLAGIDALVIDDTEDPSRPVHVTLLFAGMLIVENLANLGALPASEFIFHAAPVKVKRAAAFPVRAYGVMG